MVECELPKLKMRVRSSLLAPKVNLSPFYGVFKYIFITQMALIDKMPTTGWQIQR